MYKVHKSIYNKITVFAKKFKDFILKKINWYQTYISLFCYFFLIDLIIFG